jgi:hypothetical protein
LLDWRAILVQVVALLGKPHSGRKAGQWTKPQEFGVQIVDSL